MQLVLPLINIDMSVLLQNTPLIKFMRNYIWNLGGVFPVSSLVKISMISLISSLSLKLYVNSLVSDQKIFSLLQKTLVIFRNFHKMFVNICVTFGQVLQKFWKSLENGHKFSENDRKCRHQYVYIMKRTLHLA